MDLKGFKKLFNQEHDEYIITNNHTCALPLLRNPQMTSSPISDSYNDNSDQYHQQHDFSVSSIHFYHEGRSSIHPISHFRDCLYSGMPHIVLGNTFSDIICAYAAIQFYFHISIIGLGEDVKFEITNTDTGHYQVFRTHILPILSDTV